MIILPSTKKHQLIRSLAEEKMENWGATEEFKTVVDQIIFSQYGYDQLWLLKPGDAGNMTIRKFHTTYFMKKEVKTLG